MIRGPIRLIRVKVIIVKDTVLKKCGIIVLVCIYGLLVTHTVLNIFVSHEKIDDIGLQNNILLRAHNQTLQGDPNGKILIWLSSIPPTLHFFYVNLCLDFISPTE